MITDKQRQSYRAYMRNESYVEAGEDLGVSGTTIHQQVKTVRSKIEESVNMIQLDDGVYETDFGLKFVIDSGDIKFIDADEQ